MIKQVAIGFLMMSFHSLFAQIQDSGQVITIPVVMHVLYNTSDQNISDAQIESQIQVLNEDFRRKNADAINTPSEFLSVAADCGIEFQLANFDSEGNATSGITRTQTSKIQFANDDYSLPEKGGVASWGTNYLNLWVTNLPDGLGGWANFGLDSSRQGVVIDYEFFGSIGTAKAPYNLGRTATHEIGHWLKLVHLEASGCDTDDGIEDTPLQEKSLSGNITSNFSCGTNDMTSNFMQYVDDAVMNLFTLGQKKVMREILFTYYQPLLQNVDKTVGLTRDLNEIAHLSTFPNPISTFHFNLTQEIPSNATVNLFTLEGQRINHQITQISSTEFLLSETLTSGTYLLTVQLETTYYRTKLNLSF